jgi:hypothetical protein
LIEAPFVADDVLLKVRAKQDKDSERLVIGWVTGVTAVPSSVMLGDSHGETIEPLVVCDKRDAVLVFGSLGSADDRRGPIRTEIVCLAAVVHIASPLPHANQWVVWGQ